MTLQAREILLALLPIEKAGFVFNNGIVTMDHESYLKSLF